MGRIPLAASHEAIKATFRRFGPILDVLIFTKPASARDAAQQTAAAPDLNFGFVSFVSGSSVEAIMGAANSKSVPFMMSGTEEEAELLVERRRDQRPNAIDKLRER